MLDKLKINIFKYVKMLINKLRYWYHDFKKSIFTIRGSQNKITKSKNTVLFVKWDIEGNNNHIEFGDCYLKNVTIKVRGNNHHIKIGNEVYIYGGILWIEDDNNEILIGENTSIQSAHIAVTEKNKKVMIGRNCMLAEDVIIRTGDSHPIIDCNTNKLINEGKNVIIKDHVWIGARVQILKGVTLENDCIIGTGSIVTKSVNANTIVAGNPAKEIKASINWISNRIN
jgi:acetyltransferase-like isoleucine patch superfamily enzyme